MITYNTIGSEISSAILKLSKTINKKTVKLKKSKIL